MFFIADHSWLQLVKSVLICCVCLRCLCVASYKAITQESVAVWAPLLGVEFWAADRAVSNGLHCNHPKRSETALTTDDIHQLQQDTRAHNELRAPMNPFMERQFANQEPLRNDLLIPSLEARINQAAKLRGDLAQMVHTISRNFTIRDANQIMEQLILRCQGDLNVYIRNETLMHNHCMDIVSSLDLKILYTMLSVED